MENLKNVAPIKDFSQDTYKNGETVTSANHEELEKAYDDTLNKVNGREVVDGAVIAVNKREVVMNVGYKSDGIIPLNEFRYNPDLKVGGTMEVYTENQEDKRGQLALSHRKARAARSWDRVNAALKSEETIKGLIRCRVKGGMIVDVFRIEAFLPGSQIGVRPTRDYDVFVGRTMEPKVVKISQEFKNAVVSHKVLVEAELEQQKKEIIGKLEKEQVLEGAAKSITSYGALIDLGSVDDLIHTTDLSWDHVSDLKKVVGLDQKLDTVIPNSDNKKKRIAPGLKQLTPHPWDALDTDLKVDDKVEGKVVVMAGYGTFIEIATGVEGLIHILGVLRSQHLCSAQDFMKVDDEVEAIILALDHEKRKMSLGTKQLKQDPWEAIEEEYLVDFKHTAKVCSFTNFGVFVEIEKDIDGLIRISDLSRTKKVKHPSEFTQVGADIEVQVLEIDKESHRLSLGYERLEKDPWDILETVFTVGSIHEGTITEILDKGAVIALPYDVEGFVTPKHLVKEDGSQTQLDEKPEFKVIEFNKDARGIILSHSRVFEDVVKAEERAEKKAASGAKRSFNNKREDAPMIQNQAASTTLGDIDALAALKKQLEGKK